MGDEFPQVFAISGMTDLDWKVTSIVSTNSRINYRRIPFLSSTEQNKVLRGFENGCR
jgi:hypothetical protein